MAETCIVCLGDLRTLGEEDVPSDAAEVAEATGDGVTGGDSRRIDQEGVKRYRT